MVKINRPASLLTCLIVTGLLLTGCEQPPPETAEKQSRVATMVLTDLQGVEHSLADYRGKWVIVNYWATWCPPCLEEIPELVQLHNEHKEQDAVVWGVNREDIPLADLKTFVAKQQISYPIFQVSADSSSPLGPVLGIPTTYLVSPEGEVVARHVGLVTVQKLEAFLQQYRNQ
ncbi:MAG: TlpA family protein disulfide reductase [Candidatus Polarisedimenticolaceae bacterium]|nr:TlpA family protein disulfide reductase [Candidatus Polarisedimenticolaceae bacterium]